MKQHPLKYSLDLFQVALDALPSTVPAPIVEKARAALEHFVADTQTREEDVQAAVVELGKASWAYRKAFEEVLLALRQERLAAMIGEELSTDVRVKYEKWLAKKVKSFEEAFTGDERFAIGEATVVTEEHLREAAEQQVVGAGKAAYAARVQELLDAQAAIDAKIQELRGLAHDSPDYSADILVRARYFEEGWASISPDPTLDAVQKALAEYHAAIHLSETDQEAVFGS